MNSNTNMSTNISSETMTTERELSSWNAVAEWYHSYFTGIVLFAVSRLGAAKAEELVYEIFCHQRREKFLPGLKKLGLDTLPPAVAAAQYHYLSNHIGGVSVEYMYESERKAWIRYSAPRWIWSGTALCGIPPEVSRAMLAGWHAQNGRMLNNPNLGFVCTKQTVDGQSGLEGYYFEYDHPLAPDERLRFARHEDAPDFDAAAAPQLPTTTWPATRLAKAHRNYAMEYVRSAFPVAMQLWGPDSAGHFLQMAGRLIGMQFYHQTAKSLGGTYERGAEGFAHFMRDLGQAQGDSVQVQRDGEGFLVQQTGWTFFEGLGASHPQLETAWNGLLEGALQAHNHRLQMRFAHSMADGKHALEWHVKD